jgi:hypothetical protein
MARRPPRRPDGWILPRSDGPYPLSPESLEHRQAVDLLLEVQAAGGFNTLPRAYSPRGTTLRNRYTAAVRRVSGYGYQPRPDRYSDPKRYRAELIQFCDRYLQAAVSVTLTYNLKIHHHRRIAAGLVPGVAAPEWVNATPTVDLEGPDEPPRVLAEDPYDPYAGVLDRFDLDDMQVA